MAAKRKLEFHHILGAFGAEYVMKFFSFSLQAKGHPYDYVLNIEKAEIQDLSLQINPQAILRSA